MKAIGMSQADLGRKLATMRTVIGNEVLRARRASRRPSR